MFNFWLWLLDILGTIEMILRFTCQLIFWLGAIFLFIFWLKMKINNDYEKMERQFEEDNYRSELREKKSEQRLKKINKGE